MSPSRILKPLRTLHLYLGVFMAPALLFFAFTGALQSLGLHEASRGAHYKPPAWVVRLAHLHKKQSLDMPTRRALPPRAVDAAVRAGGMEAPAKGAGPRPAPDKPGLWPMKAFFVLVALSLASSTLTGLYMGWRHMRDRRRYAATLALGLLVPALLLLV